MAEPLLSLTVRECDYATDIAHVAVLFREYAASLDVDLCFQGFADELASLPGAYARPHGRIFLALAGNLPVGVLALRPLGQHAGELKRLYVLPTFRGRGLARQLAPA